MSYCHVKQKCKTINKLPLFTDHTRGFTERKANTAVKRFSFRKYFAERIKGQLNY